MDIVDGIAFNISSEHIEASSLFTGHDEITVYVEGYRDISFWKHFFSNTRIKNQVNVVEISKNSNANGKSIIISMVRDGTLLLGNRLLIAIDSDYDYLLNNNHDIHSKEFCFQTYCYSIENFYFDPTDSLELCGKAANCYEFSNEIRCISDVLTQWSRKNIKNFIRYLSNNIQEELHPIYIELEKLSIDTENFTDEAIKIPLEFASKGLHQDNLYFFFHGHSIQSKCLQLLKNVFDRITKNKVAQIKANPIHSDETRTQLCKEFCNSRIYIESIVYCRNINTNPFYGKICADIDSFINKHY